MDYVGLVRCAGPMAVHFVGKVVAPIALPCLIGSASVFYFWTRLYGLA